MFTCQDFLGKFEVRELLHLSAVTEISGGERWTEDTKKHVDTFEVSTLPWVRLLRLLTMWGVIVQLVLRRRREVQLVLR